MTTQQDEQDVLRCEQRRYEAMVQGDLATLDALLADELTYIHSGGRLDSKAQFLESMARRYRVELITADEARVRVYGAVGVVTGTGQMRLTVEDQPVRFRFRFTVVYHKANGRWQMVAVQHTRLPEG